MEPEPAALPDDALAEVLRRLPPHVLAEARRVCKAWRDAVDGRLRGNLLPRSVCGIFINFTQTFFSEFFSRPSTCPAIDGGLDFLPCMGVKVTDHCHGLLLCRESGDNALPRDYVVNPATRRWVRLPKRPPPHMPGFEQTAYLTFEPAVSMHYQVFLIPRAPLPCDGETDDDNPAVARIGVAPCRWEKTTFLREGEAARIVANMQWNLWYGHYRYQYSYHAIYQHQQSALYIHCRHGYLTRMSLSNHTYRVIKLPGASEFMGYPNNHHLGRSLRGVYYAILDDRSRLQVWYLSESCGRIEWILKHDTCLKTFEHDDYAQQVGRQWILQDVNYRKWCSEDPENHKATVEEKYDWNFDEDNVIDTENVVEEAEDVDGDYFLLGFHPYKEVVFLISSAITTRGLAYDWNISKFQDLGSSRPWMGAVYDEPPYGKTDTSFFPYTPCWMGEFPGNELESLFEDEKLYREKLEQEAQLKEESNCTYMGEYELRKHCGRAKRVKDFAAKVRRRRHIAAR
ncbi:hypothetical protein VPH35_115396 [Triticum aestivum]